jgi:membrane protease YdiL (CAAX protease family)
MSDSMTERQHSGRRAAALLELCVVLALLGISLSVMSVSEAVNGGVVPKLFLLLRMAGLLMLCTWFLRRGGESWAEVGLRRPRRWWLVPVLALGGFVLLIVVSRIVREVVLPAMDLPPPQLASARLVPGDLAEYLFWAVLFTWFSTAFGEEMVVRGFLLDRVTKVIGSTGTASVVAAVFVQAALFGSFHFHQGAGGAVMTGVIGVVFGVIWLLSGRNLWAGILLHGLINFVTHTEQYSAAASLMRK